LDDISLCIKDTSYLGEVHPRLIKFLDFLGYQGTKEEKARAFAVKTRGDSNCAFNSILKFFQSKSEQIDRKERW
jgi:hypothetical protein